MIFVTSSPILYSPSGRIDNGKTMPCEMTPAIFIVLIRNFLLLRNSNSGFSGNTESISQNTTLSPILKPFCTITVHPRTVANSILSFPSIGTIELISSICANVLDI